MADFCVRRAVAGTLNKDSASAAGDTAGGNSQGGEGKQERYKAKFEEIKQRVGKCRCCKGEHSYKNKWNNIWPSDRLFNCKKFSNLTPTKRAELLQ